MGSHKWRNEDEQLLREIYPLMPNREIAGYFGVTKIAINHKSSRLGLDETQKTYRTKSVFCANCGKTLRRPVCSTLNYKKTFCSQTCYIEWRHRHAYGIDPDFRLSTYLAYVCGVILGDGSVCRSSWGEGPKGQRAFAYLVNLEVIEKAFAESFSNALKHVGLNPRIYFVKKKGNRQDTYYVKAYSKKFVDWWAQQSITTFETMFLEEEPLLKEFVRGFFESEGSYYKQDHGSYYQTHCQMANTDLDRLKMFEKGLSRLSFKTKIYVHEEHRENRKPFHYILRVLGGKTEHARFIEKIKPCIKNHLS